VVRASRAAAESSTSTASAARTVPALAIHGTRRPAELQAMPKDVRDFLVAVMDSIDADLEALPERNAAANVVPIPEAGHMVHLEAAEAVAGHVSAFVTQLL
jgi:pimeloyl-ACP methyl ester carboxylesterase